MARSGSYNFTLTRNNLITHALRSINLIAKNETPTDEMMQYSADALNILIKSWEGEGIQMWNRRRGYLFTAYQTESYTLGPTGTHATNSYISTQLNGALAASATAVTVDSTTGMTVGDNIGVELTAGSRFWTTIATIPTSTTLTLTTGVTTAAADNNYVITYTSKIQRPLRLVQATLKDITTSIEVTMAPISYDQYFDYPNKTTDGQSSTYYYDKTMDNGTLYLYPRPNNVDKIVCFTYHEALEDVDSSTHDVDFPTEWLAALKWNLAVELAYAYGKYPELEKIEPKALYHKNLMQWFDTDEEDLIITVS